MDQPIVAVQCSQAQIDITLLFSRAQLDLWDREDWWVIQDQTAPLDWPDYQVYQENKGGR